MDWSKIKTIFILAFLVLDVYLAFQFMKVRDINNYGYITDASFEEKLSNDNITMVDLPKVSEKQQYVSAKAKFFTEKEINSLHAKNVSFGDGTTLRVNLEKPLKLSGKFDPEYFNSFVEGMVIHGDQYQFWKVNEQSKTIVYFQKYNNKQFFQNINGQLIFHLNDNNEVIGYVQTYLEGIEVLTDEQEILAPIRAVETLYKKGLLKPKSNITKVELGYSTLVQLSASQVLAPTWRFEINDSENLYVNAIEGYVIQLNNNNENKIVE